MNGFRTPPKQSRKEEAKAFQVELENVNKAVQLTQMLLRQLMQAQQEMQKDLARSFSVINELQYKVQAAQKLANLDSAKLNEICDQLRLADFEEAAAKQDEKEQLEVADVVSETSVMVLTSLLEDGTTGIFRSRISLHETGNPKLMQDLLGKKVGDKVEAVLNGTKHIVEILSIKNPPVLPTLEQEATEAPEATA